MKEQEKQFDEEMYSYSFTQTRANSLRSSVVDKSTKFSENESKKEKELIRRNSKTKRNKLMMDEQSSTNKMKLEQNQSNLDDSPTPKQPKKSHSHPPSSQLSHALQTLSLIKHYRKNHKAPVDIVGCQVLHDPSQPLQVQKYQKLVALMLSIQTKDQITGKVMGRLKAYGLRPGKIGQIQEEKLVQLIHESNFNRRKAKNIIEASKKILKQGLPTSIPQLLTFSGIGTKIATLYMRCAQGQNEGIGVDTHVHRISNKLGWVHGTKNPNQTEEALQRLFPKSEWDGINIALVGFGQILCEAKKPRCWECPVGKLCPSYKSYLQF